jgi:ethanolamine ammonia-lyase small subunit
VAAQDQRIQAQIQQQDQMVAILYLAPLRLPEAARVVVAELHSKAVMAVPAAAVVAMHKHRLLARGLEIRPQ